MSNDYDLAGKVVVVTGGGKGIGRGISERFLKEGAKVIIAGRSAPEVLPFHQANVAVFYPCDVRECDQINCFIDHVISIFGKLDVLVNNVGGTPYRQASDASARYTSAIVDLNLIAPMNFSEAANAKMQGQPQGGCIINIASVSGVRPSPGTAAYGAAKAGVLSLSDTFATIWGPKVRVNSIIAGIVKTNKTGLHLGDNEGIDAISSGIPMERLGLPSDVANACVYLAGSTASYVTGARLSVHGGGEKLMPHSNNLAIKSG